MNYLKIFFYTFLGNTVVFKSPQKTSEPSTFLTERKCQENYCSR